MLTNRQFKIFKYYVDNKNSFITTKEISSFFEVSIRTIKSELNAIRAFSSSYTSFVLETVPNKGTKLKVTDEDLFKAELIKLQKSVPIVTDNAQTRINSLIYYLIDKTNYATKFELLDTFYISESTLYKYVNEIKKLLPDFNLKLEYKTNIGYRITGDELDKRMCIAKIGIKEESAEHLTVSENTTTIYDVVADTFIKYKYHVNEKTLQNITAHISRTLNRLKNFHYINKKLEQTFSATKEFKIADEILNRLIHKQAVQKTHYLNEVSLLTQIILGKLDYTENDELQEEINEFIHIAFSSIQKKYYINLNSVDNLKLLLALHLVPLFYRIKSGTQLVNLMASEIHHSFPQAYDIALYFSMLIKEKFGLIVAADEISYLALYFNYGLENYPSNSTGKKILIITPLRKSETILLRHKILKWFPNQIEEINFIYPDSDEFDIEEYDAIFSTEENLEKYQGGVNYISLFPSEKDFKKINLAINGFTDISSIIEKFSKDCFYFGEAATKEEILRIVVNNARQQYALDTHFFQVIMDREKISSSYFGNGIAMPHPLTPVTNETFVSIGILKKPIPWDSKHNVHFVLLVSIAKNNPKEFQFWYYMSSLVRDEKFLVEILAQPTFEKFIEVLNTSLKKEFS